MAFCLCMGSLALMELANFLSLRASPVENAMLWKRLSLLGEMLFVGNCLLFTVIFVKKDIAAALKIWRWVLPPAYILPGVLFVLLFIVNESMAFADIGVIKLGQIARYFHIILFVAVIVNLMNLENTFRSSLGSERWRVQYMIFGLGSILLFYVYILSRRLLYNVIDVDNIYMMSAVVLAGNILMTFSVIRNKVVDGEIFISRKVIYSSFSLIAIALYSIVVALSAQIVKSFDLQKNVKLEILFIFFAALFMLLVFYKETFRRRVKALINKNFRMSKYDYHDEWMVF